MLCIGHRFAQLAFSYLHTRGKPPQGLMLIFISCPHHAAHWRPGPEIAVSRRGLSPPKHVSCSCSKKYTQNPLTVWADSSDFTNPHSLSARWRIIHLWGKQDCSKDAHRCKYHSKQTSVQVVNITQIIYNNGLWKNICWDSPTKNQGGCSWGGRARHLVIERLGVWFLSVSQSILVQGTEYHIALQGFNQSEY